MADGFEHGTRADFLGRARLALRDGVPPNVAHPRPAAAPATVPVATPRDQGADLVAAFAAAASAADATVHVIPAGAVPLELVGRIVEEHGVRRAVATSEPHSLAVGGLLTRLGVVVELPTVEAAARADLGITDATAAIASTGSVALDSSSAGSRVAGLLPTVHLCVVAASQIVATPSAVLRGLGARAGGPPSNFVLVTGPSRTGDIEQILTLGVHGPTALHIVVLERA